MQKLEYLQWFSGRPVFSQTASEVFATVCGLDKEELAWY